MDVLIRAERTEDFEAIAHVNEEAFGRTEEAMLIDQLRSSEAFVPELSLVATKGTEIFGHILFTKIKIIDSLSHCYESLALAPIAVRTAYQHQGIGSALIREGLHRAREIGYLSAIVLGHDDYYPRFGFTPASHWNITAPFDVPDEAFMAVELVENGLKNVSGIVIYAKEFEAV
ncbi:GCN5 family acetyltransferase [Niabella ginsenosidivorans]|uniref:GCN5 family acetyltransferase n=1 Tax=Niabella ginsenosidivorans TaxID=1176587 RepID=A0A1A9HYG8_9BACT|nr:N-acetyltransferase [Niabella ginsenosidivorans]ANH80135.1 GCN5 family acetyltransferase [Niabella ginsenosidivorans]